jgi:hypothetical protein
MVERRRKVKAGEDEPAGLADGGMGVSLAGKVRLHRRFARRSRRLLGSDRIALCNAVLGMQGRGFCCGSPGRAAPALHGSSDSSSLRAAQGGITARICRGSADSAPGPAGTGSGPASAALQPAGSRCSPREISRLILNCLPAAALPRRLGTVTRRCGDRPACRSRTFVSSCCALSPANGARTGEKRSEEFAGYPFCFL